MSELPAGWTPEDIAEFTAKATAMARPAITPHMVALVERFPQALAVGIVVVIDVPGGVVFPFVMSTDRVVLATHLRRWLDETRREAASPQAGT